jgi:hypothetical protein
MSEAEKKGEVYHRPANTFITWVMGNLPMTLIPGSVDIGEGKPVG